jgi:hypothetical protein
LGNKEYVWNVKWKTPHSTFLTIYKKEKPMLEYTLEVNDLTDNPDDFRAAVTNVRSYTQEDIIDRLMQIGAGLTRSDITAVLEAEKQVVSEIIADGGAVNTELFNAYPSIPGVFSSLDDTVNGTDRRVKINLHAGIVLRNAAKQVKTKRLAAVVTGTIITAVTDIKTGSVNGILTPGRDIKITGSKVKITGDNPSVGLFFVPETGAPIAVDPTDIVINHPSEIIAVIPALTAGTYKVRIVTQFSSGKHLKTPHDVTFDKPLTVQ